VQVEEGLQIGKGVQGGTSVTFRSSWQRGVPAGEYLAQHAVAVEDELGASFDDGPPVTGDEFLRPHPAARAGRRDWPRASVPDWADDQEVRRLYLFGEPDEPIPEADGSLAPTPERCEPGTFR
jgi:hypothetical protein